MATTVTRGKIRRDISSVFHSLSGIAPPHLPDRYAEMKSLFTAGAEKAMSESWVKLLLDHEKETVAKRFGSYVCLFRLVPSFL